MIRSIRMKGVLCALVVPLLSCNLLDVSDSEQSNSGRGAPLFDPYQSNNSGAIRLSLQYLNGCAVLPNGQMAAKNSLPIPYPDACPDLFGLDPFAFPARPTGTLKLLGNTEYFLNQFTVTDTVVNQHNNPADLSEAVKWITQQSRFQFLDWGNLSEQTQDWYFIEGLEGTNEDSWTREVLFGNANWQKVTNDTFTVEVLDRGGVVRASASYNRSDLFVDTPHAGHSRIAWRMENVAPPRSPGDTEVRPVQTRPGRLVQFPTSRTLVRMDLLGSTNPFKTLKVPDLSGDGALRVTWSQMPSAPFYFPVTFVSQDAVPTTCTDDAGLPKACAFGLDPQLDFAPPANGTSYAPGETVSAYVTLRDSLGNRLHPPDLLPSVGEILSDQANGIVVGLLSNTSATTEADAAPMVTVSGPLQDMRVNSAADEAPSFLARPFPFPFIEDLATSHIGPSLYTTKVPTRFSIKLPDNAKAGTYVALIKFTRFFMGERLTKLKPFFFQVGQDAMTSYPSQVGNCQICHRGVLSLENVRHGLSVDHVEACKSCHLYASDQIGRPQEAIHRIHMRSQRYTAARNDCTLCHLTREGATRPSVSTCASCHPSVHGGQYFASQFTPSGPSNRFGNCAQSCHVEQLPKNHILPEN